MSKLFKWERGRQGPGYAKLLLAQSKWLGFDLYLLKVDKNVSIPPHVDPVPYGDHHRINVMLSRHEIGSTVVIDKDGSPREGGFIHYLRPDIHEHFMSKVQGRPTYILSFGWLTNKHRKNDPHKPG